MHKLFFSDVPIIFLRDQLQLKYWYDFSNTSLHSDIGGTPTEHTKVNKCRLQPGSIFPFFSVNRQ